MTLLAAGRCDAAVLGPLKDLRTSMAQMQENDAKAQGFGVKQKADWSLEACSPLQDICREQCRELSLCVTGILPGLVYFLSTPCAGHLLSHAASVLTMLANRHTPTSSLLVVQVQDEQFARVRVLFETGSNQGYQFKTHPNIDKQLYASNVLGLKDSDRSFPTGSALPILKWRMQVRCALLRASRRPATAINVGSYADSVSRRHCCLARACRPHRKPALPCFARKCLHPRSESLWLIINSTGSSIKLY